MYIHWSRQWQPWAQMVKNPPAMWETWVQSLGWEDPLEEGMASHFSILAWRILWTEEPGGLQSMRSQRVAHDWSNWVYIRVCVCMCVCRVWYYPQFQASSRGVQTCSPQKRGDYYMPKTVLKIYSLENSRCLGNRYWIKGWISVCIKSTERIH